MNAAQAALRDANARVAAKQQYEDAARAHFEMEEVERLAGAPRLAREDHEAGTIAGHAAWAELVDPDPR